MLSKSKLMLTSMVVSLASVFTVAFGQAAFAQEADTSSVFNITNENIGELQKKLDNPNITQFVFSEDITIDEDTPGIKTGVNNPKENKNISDSVYTIYQDGLNGNGKRNETKITIKDGVTVNFNFDKNPGYKIFDIRLKLFSDQVFSFENNGTLNFTNAFNPIYVYGGGVNSEFNIIGNKANGSSININENTDCAINVLTAGKININNANINIKSSKEYSSRTTSKSYRKSGIYLGGDNGSGEANIVNSVINIDSAANDHGATPFSSNAKFVTIKNSQINSIGRAAYNFEITSSITQDKPDPCDPNERGNVSKKFRQTFTVDNSNIVLTTPSDAKSTYHGYNEGSVGLNTFNTDVILKNNSFVKHVNETSRNYNIASVSLSNSKLTVDNSELDTNNIITQHKYYNKVNKDGIVFNCADAIDFSDKGIYVKDNSKVTIKDLNKDGKVRLLSKGVSNIFTLSRGKPHTYDMDSTNLPKIVIDGGSVDLPLDENGNPVIPEGTKLINSNGEELTRFEIPSENFKDNYTINITEDTEDATNHPEYDYGLNPNRLHDGNAIIWTPAVDLNYHKNKSDAKANESVIKSVVVPRGSSSEFVGEPILTEVDGKNVNH